MENWEKSFDEKLGGEEKHLSDYYVKDIKQFISTLLKAEREKIIDAVRLEKKKIIMNDQWEEKWEKGFNSAVDKLNNKIEKL